MAVAWYMYFLHAHWYSFKKLVAAFYQFIYPLLLLDYKNIKFGDYSTNA